MTAPAPLDLPAVLDDLERAHAAATPGPWFYNESTGAVFGRGERINETVLTLVEPAIAAAIVALHNAVPTLIAELRKRDAALRAVEALAEELGGPPTVAEHGALRHALADRLRACITAALSPESVPS